MLAVVTPATNRRLTTAEHARLDLGFSESDLSNPKLDRLIDQASAMAAKYCRRTFARETLLQTLRGCDIRASIVLERGPVAQLVDVSWNGAALAATGYEVDAGSLYRLTESGQRLAWRGSLLAVRYVAGYILPGDPDPDEGDPVVGEPLPDDIERAAIRLIAAMVSSADRDPLIKSEDVQDVGSVSYWVPGSMSSLPSPEAEALLRPYRIVRVR